MKTEDFLRKYLPKERRGKVILKEQDPEITDKLDREQELIGQIEIDWDNMTVKN